MGEQLNLLGDEPATVDRSLGPVQRLIVAELEQRGPLSVDELGGIVHAHRGRHGVDETCRFCAIDGRHVAARLRRRGVVVRGHDGYIRLPNAAGLQGPSGFPAGF